MATSFRIERDRSQRTLNGKRSTSGRSDWIANAVLFAVYHLRTPRVIATALIPIEAYPSRRSESARMEPSCTPTLAPRPPGRINSAQSSNVSGTPTASIETSAPMVPLTR
jgi:hypothetical protein